MITTSNSLTARPAPPNEPAQPKKEFQVRESERDLADIYNGSRSFGNRVSAMALGAVNETVATVVQTPYLAYKIVSNLLKAETVGPNIKTLGSLAAIPGSLLVIPAAPFYGAFKGFQASSKGEHAAKELLTPDTGTDYARSLFVKPHEGEARTMTGNLVNTLNDFGKAKLSEGQKPHDIPLLSPLFSVVGGVASGLISGVVGLVAGLAAGAITGGKDIGEAFTSKELSVGQRIGKACLSPLNLVAGPALAWNGIKEATPRGFVDGWRHGPVRPIVDTSKASAMIAAGVIKEAWER